MDLQRYTIRSHEGYSHTETLEDDKGPWVKHEDAVAAIEEARREAYAEGERDAERLAER